MLWIQYIMTKIVFNHIWTALIWWQINYTQHHLTTYVIPLNSLRMLAILRLSAFYVLPIVVTYIYCTISTVSSQILKICWLRWPIKFLLNSIDLKWGLFFVTVTCYWTYDRNGTVYHGENFPICWALFEHFRYIFEPFVSSACDMWLTNNSKLYSKRNNDWKKSPTSKALQVFTWVGMGKTYKTSELCGWTYLHTLYRADWPYLRLFPGNGPNRATQ